MSYNKAKILRINDWHYMVFPDNEKWREDGKRRKSKKRFIAKRRHFDKRYKEAYLAGEINEDDGWGKNVVEFPTMKEALWYAIQLAIMK